ncbi:MAG TPA: hypothetical protein VNM90_17820 [Haliangium sp.]|nr:hypothetical protein [Haliangium sp.]
MEKATVLQLLGAGGFGTVLGWLVFYINRHRTDDVKLSDLVTLLGVVGGSAVLALFPASTDLFGAYGIGLAVGFFQYFLVIAFFVRRSKNFDSDWFLDGRRKRPDEPYYIPTREELARLAPSPMSASEQRHQLQETGASSTAEVASSADVGGGSGSHDA